MLHIFLARPLQTHRCAGHGHGDRNGLLGVLLGEAATAETAAGVHFVHDHFLQRNARRLRRRGDGAFTILSTYPNFERVRIQ